MNKITIVPYDNRKLLVTYPDGTEFVVDSFTINVNETFLDRVIDFLFGEK